MAQEKRTPKKIILEIGFGSMPLPFLAKLNPQLKPLAMKEDEVYIGAEKSHPSWMQEIPARMGREAIDDLRREGLKAVHVTWDGRQLPMQSGRAWRVHLHNVLNDPNLPLEDIEGIIREAKRVVKPGRPVIIVHSYNPLTEPIAPFFHDFKREPKAEEKIRALMPKLGQHHPQIFYYRRPLEK